MHFIANRAIDLHHSHSPAQQIVYSPSFTALSFFLPILVLMFAFYLLGGIDRAKPLFVLVSGFLTGAAIVSMHFVGNLGISNWACKYQLANVVGAAIIAVAASLLALLILVRLHQRQHWTDSWWKRSLCAGILASAVSAMHWVATVGTTYVRKRSTRRHGGTSRTQTVIVCAVLSLLACVVLLGVETLRSKQRRTSKLRRQQVVLACVWFDHSGQMLLGPEANLPCRKICDRYIETSFGEDELNWPGRTFLRVSRASRYWASLKDLIPTMAAELETAPGSRRYVSSHKGSVSLSHDEGSSEFGIMFEKLFCVAARDLSDTMHESIENIGILFEEPIETGTTSSTNLSRRKRLSSLVSHRHSDIESCTDSEMSNSIGQGKYLLLTRQLTKPESDKFAALGYRYGSIEHSAEALARRLDTPQEALKAQLERMRLSACPKSIMSPGVNLACFLIKPSVHRSWNVLVPVKMQNRLPMISLQADQLTEWQAAILDKLDEWTIKDMLAGATRQTVNSQEASDFVQRLLSSVIRLIDHVGNFDDMLSARFSARQVQVPQSASSATSSTTFCRVICIRLLATIHSRAPPTSMTYMPLSFLFEKHRLMSISPEDREATRLELMRRSSLAMSVKKPKTEHRISFRDAQADPQSTPVHKRGSIQRHGGEVDHVFETDCTRTPSIRFSDILLETPGSVSKDSWVQPLFELFMTHEFEGRSGTPRK